MQGHPCRKLRRVRQTTEDAKTNLQKLACELERGRLEANAPWRVRKHEAKVDVNDVPFIVQQQIPVVTILELLRQAKRG